MKTPLILKTVIFSSAALAMLAAPSAFAANVTWNATQAGANGTWTTAANWVGGSAPLTTDTAVFSSANGNQTVTFNPLSGNITIGGLVFNNTNSGGTNLRTDATANETLTLGSAGITINSGAGPVSFGNSTLGQRVFIVLGAAQTWTNNSANTLTLASNNNPITNGGFTLAIAGSGNVTIDSANSGTGGMTKNGTGTLALNGANTYSGGTVLNSGKLVLGNNNALGGAASALTINGGTIDVDAARTNARNNVTAWNGDFTFGGTNTWNTGTGAVTMNASRTVTVSASTMTVGGNISGVGFSLTKAGDGVLTLNGTNNTYDGGTNVNAGTLVLSKTTSKPATGTITVAAGAALGLAVGGASPFYASTDVDTLWTGSMSGVSLNASSLVGIDTTQGDFTYATAQSTRGLVKTGANKLTLTGANSFTGGTVVSNGILTVSGSGTLGGATNSLTVRDQGSLDLAGTSQTAGAVTFNGTGTTSNGTLTGSSYTGINGTVTAVLAGSAALTTQGTGQLTLNATNTFSGGIIINETSSVKLLSTAAAGTGMITSNMSANGGSLVVAADATIYGFRNIGRQGGLAGLIDPNTGTAVRILTIGAGGLTEEASATGGLGLGNSGNRPLYIQLGANQTWANNSGTYNISHSAGTFLSPTLDTSGFALTLDGVGNINMNAVGGIIGTGGLIKNGSGTTTLSSANNTYSGGTVINAGTLSISGIGTLGSTAGALSVGTLAAGGTGSLDLGGTSQTVGNVTFNGTGTTSNGTLTGSSYAGINGTVSAVLAGSGALTKSGSGTLTLSNTNTYSGSTLVTVGTLVINGSIAASSGVQVDSGAVLSGSGSVSAISGAGWVNPGNSPGILTASTASLSGGLDFSFELTSTGSPTWNNATASVNDVLHLTNTSNPFVSTSATAANVFDIYLGVASLTSGDLFNGGFFAGTVDFAGSVANGTYNYFVLGNGSGTHGYNGTNYYTLAEYNSDHSTGWSIDHGTLAVAGADFATGTVDGYVQQFSVVPEPAAWILAAFGFTTAVVFRRRRMD